MVRRRVLLLLQLISITDIASATDQSTIPAEDSLIIWNNGITDCEIEGVHPDYGTDCTEYVDCKGGVVQSRNTCPSGFAFNHVSQYCSPVHSIHCVRHICAATDASAYAAPGTKCSQFYYCADGIVHEQTCTPGSWFDFKRRSCRKDQGICREPVCAGRRDGVFPDTSHDCRRALVCQESKLRGVISCPPGQLFGGKTCTAAENVICDHPKKDTIAYPVGVDYTTEECADKLDGVYPDTLSGCSHYYFCVDGRQVFRKYCEDGKIYNGKACVYKSLFLCPIDPRNPCVSKSDGYHRDLKDCKSFYYCEAGQITYKDSCLNKLVWNGKTCVSQETFTCFGPVENSPTCKGKPKGIYQDRSLKSLCKKYYHCESGTQMEFECPQGMLFDGEECVSRDIYTCPSLDPDSCDLKSDGYYKQTSGGCRGYYLCSKNVKIVFVCDDGFVFNGKKCVPCDEYICPYPTFECLNTSNGYHADVKSGCRNYFFCENGDKVSTFQCPGIKIYNGRTCVSADVHECPVSSKGNLCMFKNDGYYLHYKTNCRSFYRCIHHKLTSYHTCDVKQKFDGVDSCTNRTYTNVNCSQDGLYADFSLKCRTYYSCINGKRTTIECSGNKVFNGDFCVSADNYKCPEECLS